ncbi:hypothetical protein ES708_16618 [subsurface metagenome]
MENDNEALVLTPREAMKILRCSRSVLYAGLKNGSIPSIRLGPRKVVIPRAKLMALLGGANDGAHP